jgi:uncharacterized membrane protein
MSTNPKPSSPDYPPPPLSEAHWPALLIVLLAIGLQVLLPEGLSAGPRWLMPSLEGVMLIGLFVASPQRIVGRNRLRRHAARSLSALVSIANGFSLVLLCEKLLHHNVTQGHALIIAGVLIWLTNVLIFSLWYWELDRDGPGNRAAGEDGAPDFLFPQMTEPELCPGWRPMFFDYLYVSMTNATAFSPTDTMPLSVESKLLMGGQSLISLVTIGLVISRAVNIL